MTEYSCSKSTEKQPAEELDEDVEINETSESPGGDGNEQKKDSQMSDELQWYESKCVECWIN